MHWTGGSAEEESTAASATAGARQKSTDIRGGASAVDAVGVHAGFREYGGFAIEVVLKFWCGVIFDIHDSGGSFEPFIHESRVAERKRRRLTMSEKCTVSWRA
ncbi:hypothetical protein U1Q18_004294 [Sarracenia purpurea var. burkii]